MPADKIVPFWGSLVCSNVWGAADHPIAAAAWMIIALLILIVSVRQSK